MFVTFHTSGIPSARKVVRDYRATAWPETLSYLNDSIAQFIDGLNDIILDFDVVEAEADHAPIVTFSHFLPHVELLPEKRYLSLPTLHSCVGSTFLARRVRRLGKSFSNCGSAHHVHAFGHTHLSWDATIDGVRYVQVPLAYPREWEQRRKSLEIGSMKGEESENRYPVCIWDSTMSSDAGKDEDSSVEPPTGFPQGWLGGWWSKYYAIMPRQPHRNQELSPWAARMYRQLPGGKIEDFDHAKVEQRYRLQWDDGAGTGTWYEKH